MKHNYDVFDLGKSTPVEQPESVIGPLGEILTRADLPPPGTRWTPRRKAEVIAAVHGGMMSVEEACGIYNISLEEFALWERAIGRGGLPALRVTRLQMNRHILTPDWPGNVPTWPKRQ